MLGRLNYIAECFLLPVGNLGRDLELNFLISNMQVTLNIQ